MESVKIVKSFTVSLNFFGFIKFSKKSILDVLKYDLAWSCVAGTTSEFKKIWNIVNTIENLKK